MSRMNNKNFTAGILALTMGNLEANLLDDSAKLEERYGQPVLVGHDFTNLETRTYKSGDYIIHALVANERYSYGLYENKCVQQWTKRSDGKMLSSDEVEKLLERQPNSGQWKFQGNNTWKMRDSVIANLSSDGKLLSEKVK